MSLEVIWVYWKLSSAQLRSEMSSSGIPPGCAVEVERSKCSSFSPQKLCPKQSPYFGFGNLDFPWWCPWPQPPGLHAPFLWLIFSPWNYGASVMDLPLKTPIKICFLGGGKNRHCWFSQEVPEAARAGHYDFGLSWKNLLTLLNTEHQLNTWQPPCLIIPKVEMYLMVKNKPTAF